MLVDIHTHACMKRRAEIMRVEGACYPLPEQLLRMMDDAHIDKAVVLTTVSPECRRIVVTSDESLEICAQRADRLIPFCNLDPRFFTNDVHADFRPMLGAYKAAGCRGIGEYFPNLPFDDPLNMNFFAQVEEIGLPLTFHIASQVGGCYGCVDEIGLPRLEKVLRACPRLTLLGHSQPFWAEISADVTEESRKGYPKGKVTPGRVVELMRSYPNLCGDLSAESGYNAIRRDPEFGYRFMEEFQDRLFFGTDIAYVGQELSIVPYFTDLKQKKRISKDAYEKITWRNADRLLGLGLA